MARRGFKPMYRYILSFGSVGCGRTPITSGRTHDDAIPASRLRAAASIARSARGTAVAAMVAARRLRSHDLELAGL